MSRAGRLLAIDTATSIAVVAGVAMMILGWGFIDGLDENVLRSSSTSMTGEILLRPDDYPSDGRTLPQIGRAHV